MFQLGFGLKCIQYVRNYTQDRLTVQLHFWREHTASGLKTTASINQFSIAPQEGMFDYFRDFYFGESYIHIQLV